MQTGKTEGKLRVCLLRDVVGADSAGQYDSRLVASSLIRYETYEGTVLMG